jgi:uncharacterized protein (TIGR03086 family)
MKLNDFQSACIAFSRTCITQAQTRPEAKIGEWSLNDLTTHLVMVNLMCAGSLAGRGPETLPAPEDVVGKDLGAAFARTTSDFLQAFATAADVTIECPTPVGPFPAWVVQTQGSLEHLVHACDLAHELGLAITPADDVVADAATRILQNTALYDTFRSMGMYGAPASAEPDASSLQRLLSYLGR